LRRFGRASSVAVETEKRIFTTKSTTLKNTLKNIGQAGQAAHDVLIMKVFTFVYFVSFVVRSFFRGVTDKKG